MKAGKRWTASSVEQWRPVAQFLVAYPTAAFLFVYGALHAQDLGVAILGAMFAAGGALLGIPVILLRRNGNGHG